jgi:hypothetical protein
MATVATVVLGLVLGAAGTTERVNVDPAGHPALPPHFIHKPFGSGRVSEQGERIQQMKDSFENKQSGKKLPLLHHAALHNDVDATRSHLQNG